MCALRHLPSGLLNFPPCVTHKPHTLQLIHGAGVDFQTLVFAYKAQSDLCIISFLKKGTLEEEISEITEFS